MHARSTKQPRNLSQRGNLSQRILRSNASMEISKAPKLNQELIFGLRFHADELLKKCEHKQMELKSLKRLDQIAKHIFREEFLQFIPMETDVKNNVKIKLQKYYEEIMNHTEFNLQAELKRALTVFLSKYENNKTQCFFDLEVRIYSHYVPVNKVAENFLKIQYPDGKAGYQYRHQKKRKRQFSDATSMLSQPSSFQDSDFAGLNQEGDEKFKDVDCIHTNESLSIGQTTSEEEEFQCIIDKAYLNEDDDLSSLVIKANEISTILEKLENEPNCIKKHYGIRQVSSGDPFIKNFNNLESSEISIVEPPKNFPIYEVFDLKNCHISAFDESKLIIHSLKQKINTDENVMNIGQAKIMLNITPQEKQKEIFEYEEEELEIGKPNQSTKSNNRVQSMSGFSLELQKSIKGDFSASKQSQKTERLNTDNSKVSSFKSSVRSRPIQVTDIDHEKYEEEKIGDFDDLSRSSYIKPVRKSDDQLEFENEQEELKEQMKYLQNTRKKDEIMISENSFCQMGYKSGLSTIRERDTECLKHTYNETQQYLVTDKTKKSAIRHHEARKSYEKSEEPDEKPLDQIGELPENSSSNRDSSYKKFEYSQSQKISISGQKGISKFNNVKNKRKQRDSASTTGPTRNKHINNIDQQSSYCCGRGNKGSESHSKKIIEIRETESIEQSQQTTERNIVGEHNNNQFMMESYGPEIIEKNKKEKKQKCEIF